VVQGRPLGSHLARPATSRGVVLFFRLISLTGTVV
jgi:hypothetical protein